MQENERAQFLILTKKIKSLYPNSNITLDAQNIYFDKLKKYSFKQVRKAFDSCLENLQFFPTIAEIIQEIEPKKDQSLKAWLIVEHALRKKIWDFNLNFGDAITHIVISSFGGFYSLAINSQELHFLEKEFCKRYELMKKIDLKIAQDFVKGRNPPIQKIFNLLDNGFREIEDYWQSIKFKKLSNMREYLHELEEKELPKDRWEQHDRIMQCYTLRKQIELLEKEVSGEKKCLEYS